MWSLHKDVKQELAAFEKNMFILSLNLNRDWNNLKRKQKGNNIEQTWNIYDKGRNLCGKIVKEENMILPGYVLVHLSN